MASHSQSSSFGSTSTSLIARVRVGDQAAWSRMVDLYAPLVYFWCRRADLGQEDAADLAQDVLAKVFSGISSFRHDRNNSTFRGWLWTISRNALIDHARVERDRAEAAGGTAAHENLQQVAEPNIGATTTSLSAGQSDLVKRAFELIQTEFNARALRAFQWIVLEGRTAVEAAEAVGMSPAAVRKSKSRILRRLREELGDVGG